MNATPKRQILRQTDTLNPRADRVTVAVTLFAVLELYKQGELTWQQEEPFGDITIAAPGASRPSAEVNAAS